MARINVAWIMSTSNVFKREWTAVLQQQQQQQHGDQGLHPQSRVWLGFGNKSQSKEKIVILI